MMLERGIEVDHTSINRWVLKFTPEIEKKFRKHKHVVGTSWRMDETYIKIKGNWKYLNNIVESDHRNVKRITNPMMGFQSFSSAKKVLAGIEMVAMLRKG